MIFRRWIALPCIRNNSTWTFLGLLLRPGGSIGLFLNAHLVFPEQIVGTAFKAYYYEKMRPALWIAVLTVGVSSAFRPLVLGKALFKLDNLSSFLMLAIFSGIAFIKNAAFHAFIARYPDTFLAMVTDTQYKQTALHRQVAVEDGRLIRTGTMDQGGGFAG